MFSFDLNRVWRSIVEGPIGLSVSMLFAYAMASALFTAASVNEWIEGGRHWLAAQRAQLEWHLESLISLWDERAARQLGSLREYYIPEAVHAQRLTEWPPLRVKSGWPGSIAVPQAP